MTMKKFFVLGGFLFLISVNVFAVNNVSDTTSTTINSNEDVNVPPTSNNTPNKVVNPKAPVAGPENSSGDVNTLNPGMNPGTEANVPSGVNTLPDSRSENQTPSDVVPATH